LFFLTANSISSSAAANYYDSNADMFVNLAHNTATTTQDGKDALGVGDQIIRTYRLRPNGTAALNGWTDPENSYDTSKTTYATATAVSDTDGGIPISTDLKITLPNISGKITAMILYIKADVTFAGAVPGVTGTVSIAENSYGQGATIISKTSAGTTSTSGYADPDGSGSDYSRVILTGNAASNDDQLPDSITIQVISDADDDGYGYDLTATGKIYDIYLQITSQNDETDEPQATAKERADLDTVYIGNDGLSRSWTTGIVTKIHEAHRDLIHRFTEYGVDSGVYTTPENWSSGLDVDTERTDWPVRFWVNKPTSLRKILEKLQEEGGFIARMRSNGNLQYIVVPGSPSASETLTADDIKNLKVSHVPFDEIVTKMHIQWNKNPARGAYADEVTLTNGDNDTKRDRLNITKDLEGVKEVKLDAYADSSSAQRWFDYYDGLIGDLYIKISGEIVNPLYYKLEVGDQIAIDSSYPYAPFGESWSGKVFMVTSTSRMAHSMKFSARQIN